MSGSVRARLAVLALAATFMSVSAAVPVLARPRPDDWDLSRYQEAAFRDSLMARHDAPGVIILSRSHLQLGQKGTRVWADVDHERLVFVAEPSAMDAYRTLVFEEYPGRDVGKVEAVRLSGHERVKVDVKEESTALGCVPYDGHRRVTVDFGELHAGDILAVRAKYTLDGVNPYFEHAFDAPIPILQCDVTIDVPRNLMEDKASRGWDWWAGSWPSYVSEHYWEKPTSWRFRWGERDIAALTGQRESRIVATTWTFDPVYGAQGTAVRRDAEAIAGVDAAYHGPMINATQLSGRSAIDRSDPASPNESNRRPTEATFGRLSWEKVGDRIVADCLSRRLQSDSRALARIADAALAGATKPDEIARALSRHVSEKLTTVDVVIGASLGDVRDPVEVYRYECASALDKAVLLAALLRVKGIEACPVLLKHGRLVAELRTASAFDAVTVKIGDSAGARYVDLDTGAVDRRLPPGDWGGMLVLPVDGEKSADVLVGEAVASIKG